MLVEPIMGAVTRANDHARVTLAMLIPRFFEISSTLWSVMRPKSRSLACKNGPVDNLLGTYSFKIPSKEAISTGGVR